MNLIAVPGIPLVDLPNEAQEVRIVIFAGGTGSIALQRGLYDALDANLDGIDTKIIVNAYDNGLSTGAVRRAINGQILGPSDVRKNQTTRLQLRDSRSPWLSFLNCRFTVEASQAQDFCRANVFELMENLRTHDLHTDSCSMLLSALADYFGSPLATKLQYDNFSLANIIYAGLAKANDNSLRAAGRIMAGAIGIPDNVLLNDDTSLFLGAITQSGRMISDEGEIVFWGSEADPFVSIFFTDVDGCIRTPELCGEARKAILDADLIILSSGTQWSSLIPTYASKGFKTAISETNAKILMVMNRIPDTDSPSQTASDIINILVPRYFDMDVLHVLADKHGHTKMRTLDKTALSKVASFTEAELSESDSPPDKHSPGKLAAAIGRVFFKDYLDSTFFLFDYDDTVVGRANGYPKSSRFNISGLSRLNRLTNVGVCTGNTIRAINLRGESAALGDTLEPPYKPLLVFADGGVNRYSYDTRAIVKDDENHPELVECIWPEALLPAAGPCSANSIIERLVAAGVPLSKIENRGNALIAIKPVDHGNRRVLVGLAQQIVHCSHIDVRECGTTTLEICRPTLSKAYALKYLYMNLPVFPQITYVGDEFESGNDHDIEDLAANGTGVKCLRVGGPAKTAFFISTLIAYLAQNVTG